MSNDSNEKNIVHDAINTVAERKENEGEVYTTQSGIRLRFRPVGSYNLAEVMAEIPTPQPPLFEHPNKPGEMLPNPADPNYHKELHEANMARNKAAGDTMLVFGVEWLDDIPESNDEWIDNLIFTTRIPPQENPDRIPVRLKKLWYLKYMTTDYMEIIKRIREMSSVPTKEGVDLARSTFQGNAEQLSDRGNDSKE